MILSSICTTALAQKNDVWKNNKGVTIGFVTHQSLKWEEDKNDCQFDSNFGFSLTTGTQYLWPRSEGWAGNRIKVGVDARWFDVSYINYKKNIKVNGTEIKTTRFDDYYDDEEKDYGRHQLHLGVGVGPTVSIAPFGNSDGQVRFLRANLYAHFNPSASAVLYKDPDGDTHASWAFVPALDYGLNIQWRFITLGVEARWGKAKYNSLISDDEDDWDYEDGNATFKGKDKKTEFTNASFRINLGFRW